MDSTAKNCSKGQCEHQPWECKEYVGDAHQKRIQPVSAPSTDDSNDGSNDRNHRYQKQGGQNTCLSTNDQATEHISAIAICSEYVR